MIGILITLCSKNQDWEEIGDTDLFKDFLDAFIFTISGKHEYKFYLGYDENDEFFKRNSDKLKKRLPKAVTVVPLFTAVIVSVKLLYRAELPPFIVVALALLPGFA